MRTLNVLEVVITRLWFCEPLVRFIIWFSYDLRTCNFQLENLANFQATCENRPTLVKTKSWADFSNFPKMKLVRNLNKLGVVHMAVKMSQTLTSGLINFSLSSSNFIDVKYSQMLTHAIVIVIWSFIAISSSTSSLLLKELKSKCV